MISIKLGNETKRNSNNKHNQKNNNNNKYNKNKNVIERENRTDTMKEVGSKETY